MARMPQPKFRVFVLCVSCISTGREIFASIRFGKVIVFACMHKHLPVCPAAQVCWQLYVFYYGVTEPELAINQVHLPLFFCISSYGKRKIISHHFCRICNIFREFFSLQLFIILYKNEVTLTKMPKYDLIFQVSLSLCFSCRASTKGGVRQAQTQEDSRHICKHPETTIPAFANPTGVVRSLFSLAYIICLKK